MHTRTKLIDSAVVFNLDDKIMFASVYIYLFKSMFLFVASIAL